MPALTIGMAVSHDFPNVWWTLQALRLLHAECAAEIELVVVDNAPDSPHAFPTKGIAHKAGATYVRHEHPVGTAAPRDRIFREARGDAVLVIDSHVAFPAGVVRRLIDWYRAHPDCLDLLQGPLIDDALAHADGRPAVHATHMEPVWRDGMFGTWASDPDLHDPEAPPKEIPLHGLGLFSCRREAWLGFHPDFRGFGGEEGYLHDKFRRAGRKTLCLPWLRWVHQFRPSQLPAPYAATLEDRLRNYLLGRRELEQSTDDVLDHFRDRLPAAAIESVVADVDLLYPQPTDCVETEYLRAVRTPSDIHEHLPQLRQLAAWCDTVVELGVRTGVSTRAFLAGRPRRLVSIDVNPLPDLAHLAAAAAVEWEPRRESSLTAEPVPCDLLFIDTLHHAAQLSAELARHAPHVRRWIVLHDTETFGINGEGGGEGLLKAVGDFLQAHPAEWDIQSHVRNCHGLTILRRWNVEADPARGVGDVVAKASHAVGLDRLATSVAKWFVSCGCAGRQAVLNRWFPFATKETA